MASLIAAVGVAGCASARDPEEAPEIEEAAAIEKPRCYQRATVVVRVDNRSSFELSIHFGSYSPARPVPGFSRTTYSVPRFRLKDPIFLRIIGGGMQLGGAARVVTEPVVCDVATLVIGPRPRYSIFYGDGLGGEPWDESDAASPPEDSGEEPEE